MDIINCSQEEWNDSRRMYTDMDTALSFLGMIQPQCFPTVKDKMPLRHIYNGGRCLGYVEE